MQEPHEMRALMHRSSDVPQASTSTTVQSDDTLSLWIVLTTAIAMLVFVFLWLMQILQGLILNVNQAAAEDYRRAQPVAEQTMSTEPLGELSVMTPPDPKTPDAVTSVSSPALQPERQPDFRALSSRNDQISIPLQVLSPESLPVTQVHHEPSFRFPLQYDMEKQATESAADLIVENLWTPYDYASASGSDDLQSIALQPARDSNPIVSTQETALTGIVEAVAYDGEDDRPGDDDDQPKDAVIVKDSFCESESASLSEYEVFASASSLLQEASAGCIAESLSGFSPSLPTAVPAAEINAELMHLLNVDLPDERADSLNKDTTVVQENLDSGTESSQSGQSGRQINKID